MKKIIIDNKILAHCIRKAQSSLFKKGDTFKIDTTNTDPVDYKSIDLDAPTKKSKKMEDYLLMSWLDGGELVLTSMPRSMNSIVNTNLELSAEDSDIIIKGFLITQQFSKSEVA